MKSLDLDLLAQAGSDSFALERAMYENDLRERAGLHEAAAIAENEQLLADAGYSLDWRPVQRVGRARVYTVRVYRVANEDHGYAVYVGCACSRLRALAHVFDQGIPVSVQDPEPGDDLSGQTHEDGLRAAEALAEEAAGVR